MKNQTLIRISQDLLNILKKSKEEGDSYEDITWDFIEPHLELSEKARKDIEKSRKEYERGETITLEELKKELKIS